MPIVTAEQTHQSLLTLIVDKKGIFGDNIAEKIDNHITTVLVTEKETSPSEHIIPISFHKTIPEIPEGTYTHIFFVWDGKKESLHILEPLLEKAAADTASFLFIADYHFFHSKLLEYIRERYAQASVLLVGDVFGNIAYSSLITTFLETAQTNDVIKLNGVGLDIIYPVLFADVISEIVHVGFSSEKKKLFLACQQHGITELSLAHAIQKVDPLIKIDFQKEERVKGELPEGQYLFPVTYQSTQKIQEVYTQQTLGKNHKTKKPTETYSPLTIQQEEKKVRKTSPRVFIVGLFFLCMLFSPVLLTLFYTLLGGVLLYASVTTVKTDNFSQGATFADSSEKLFSLAKEAHIVGGKELQVVLLGSAAQNIDNTIAQGELLATIASDGFTAGKYFQAVATGKSISSYGDFLSGVNNVKNALIALENAGVQGSLGGISFANISRLVAPYTSIIDVSPSLFGFPQKKTYAILFQNNTELRPGGGFIGSYAIVTVDHGKMGDIVIHDVYDADGQLKGHVEPPYVVRRYIPEQHWYLRDSNFDVDFSQDAKNAAFFLQQETGQEVDGVIGVDLSFVKALLLATGSVYVPEYKETVTDKNLFLLTEQHAEKNSFAGSTQKKDFLSALFTALMNKLKTQHFSPSAITPILTAVSQKDVVFGFSDTALQNVFTVSGFSSALWDGRKVGENQILDFTGLNEANIGVNKANAFVTRKVNQNLAVTPTGSVSGKLTIDYTNASKKNVWPGGPYKNYLRLILPLGTKITSIAIDGVTQTIIPAITDASVYEKNGFTLPAGFEVDSNTENGKQLYGFVTTVPEESKETIVVFYTLAQKVDVTKPTWSYSGLLFKQPGVDEYPYTFVLTFPSGFSILQKPSWISSDTNTISFEKTFVEDTPFVVSFTNNN